MGRWAQRRRAGGGPPVVDAPVPPPVPLNIVSVTATGADTVHLEFDGPFTWYSPGSGTSSQFAINTVEVLSTADGGPTGLDLQMQSAISTGDTWDLSSQPSWADVPIANPASGTVA